MQPHQGNALEHADGADDECKVGWNPEGGVGKGRGGAVGILGLQSTAQVYAKQLARWRRQAAGHGAQGASCNTRARHAWRGVPVPT